MERSFVGLRGAAGRAGRSGGGSDSLPAGRSLTSPGVNLLPGGSPYVLRADPARKKRKEEPALRSVLPVPPLLKEALTACSCRILHFLPQDLFHVLPQDLHLVPADVHSSAFLPSSWHYASMFMASSFTCGSSSLICVRACSLIQPVSVSLKYLPVCT